jgi:hypothetical protein
VRAHAQQLNTEHEAVQQQDKLTVRQAATAAQPNGPLRCGLVHERERILVVDLIATQLQPKGATPPASHKGVRPRQLQPSPRTCHCHPPPTE